MGSDEITMPMPEWIKNDDGSGVRVFAYSCALSGKEGRALASMGEKGKGGSGIYGVREELEKTKTDE